MKQNATRILSALLGISIVILTANGAAAASVSELQSELDVLSEQNSAIQAEIDAIQRQYDDNYTEMSEIVQRKADIDQQIGLLKTKIENTNAQISVYKQLIADSQEELDAAQEELTALSQEHRERIRAIEEGGTVTYWQVLFQANSFTDLLNRLNMVQEISEADRKRIESLRIAADIVTATQLNLDAEKTALDEAAAQMEADEQLLEEKRTESDELLRQLAQ